jgi:hypothetical protein
MAILKWLGLYLLANLIGGLMNLTVPVSAPVAAAGICMVAVALWKRRARRAVAEQDQGSAAEITS